MSKSNRIHILKLRAKNLKSVRLAEITEIGEILQIKGDSGQGKTTILEAIESALRGLDPEMVRRGEDSAEVMLDLDNARVHRVMKADGHETVTVTDSATGRQIAKAKDFLRTLSSDALIFDPLRFAQLGRGESKGRTERLRQQRNMLLDAMPTKLSPEDVVEQLRNLGEAAFEEASGMPLDGIDWEQHGLAVCESLKTLFYEARKAVNQQATAAQNLINSLPVPGVAPAKSAAELGKELEDARRAVIEQETLARSAKASEERRALLARQIAESEERLPAKEALLTYLSEANKRQEVRREEHRRLKEEIAALMARQDELVREGEAEREEIAQAQQMVHGHAEIEAKRAELASIGGGVASDGKVISALTEKVRKAQAAYEARKQQDAWDAAGAKASEARAKSEVYDELVAFFRDRLPRQIVASMGMPIEGLEITEGVVCYKGIPLHQLGTSEQLRISVELAAHINPRTGFLLIDRAESLGQKDLVALRDAASRLDLQLIMTFVDAGAVPGDDTIVMRNGEVVT